MSFDKKKSVTILGVSGSVGQNALDVILSAPQMFDVHAVTAGSNVELLAQSAKRLGAKIAVIARDDLYADLQNALSGSGIEARSGAQAIADVAAEKVDIVVAAIMGFAGLRPILSALKAGNNVAVANKEPLVAAGHLVTDAARESGAKIIPVDSEHNAIFQVFEERNKAQIDKIILTASGGPFLDWTVEQRKKASVAQALKHPNWVMGRKISIDSASMMNKALEVIEAHYLFKMPPEKIDVVIHPQSVVHSMVSYSDGSVLCQMGASDMRTPIAYALSYPQRMKTSGQVLDVRTLSSLTFREADISSGSALGMAYECLRSGNMACIALNAANEVAVDLFLQEKISFGGILRLIDQSLKDVEKNISAEPLKTVEEIEGWDSLVREVTLHTVTMGRF